MAKVNCGISKQHKTVSNRYKDTEMANSKISKEKKRNDEIKVRVFKEINIHFPGDVYLLEVWLAMSDRAKSTSTCKPQTTLHGLANKFVSAYPSFGA